MRNASCVYCNLTSYDTYVTTQCHKLIHDMLIQLNELVNIAIMMSEFNSRSEVVNSVTRVILRTTKDYISAIDLG